MHTGHWTNLSNANEQRLLGILDGPVVLLSVVLHVAQLLSVSALELISGRFVPGNLVNPVGLVVVTANAQEVTTENTTKVILTESSQWLLGETSQPSP